MKDQISGLFLLFAIILVAGNYANKPLLKLLFGGTIKLSGIDSDKYLGACFQIILPLKD